MKKNFISTTLIFSICAILLFFTQPPVSLSPSSWKLLIIFIGTIAAIIFTSASMELIVLMSLAISVVTKTLTINEALFGFGTPIVIFVVFAFFISRAVISTSIGKRAAFFFISKLGGSLTGISYGLILTELFVAPVTPSATARGGGIVYPIAQALIDKYEHNSNNRNVSKYLVQLCFHVNVITSAMFITAMAGNPLIVNLAQSIGVNITWTSWALAAFVPGIISLLILPTILQFLIKPYISDVKSASRLAQEELAKMGKIRTNEKIVLCTLVFLVTFWILSDVIGIGHATTAILGFLILVLTGVMSMEDAGSCSIAWRTFIWFGGFIAMSDALSSKGVTPWIGGIFSDFFSSQQTQFAIPLLLLVFFYMHYFFASITVYSSIMYTTFALALIKVGLNPFIACIILSFFANLSACLTHYGISSAPIFFSSGVVSAGNWWKNGFIISLAHILVWSSVGYVWWHIIGYI
ncbi:DASS family sodium-coupled anion symporter [Candidatus Cyrtobacter comes]|nr:DASS family sodium-coupled anion symporter [Candidatus Cyrtobacter comes]